MIDTIGNTILNSNASNLEEALELKSDEGTIRDLVIAKTSKIGEKLDFRRLAVVTKNDDENFGTYLHMGGKIAVLTVVKGANTDVAKDVAMQAAAMKPRYVFKEDVPADEVAREREVLKEQAMNEGKPAEIAEKMVQGRIGKFYGEICLVEQAYVKDGDMTVQQYINSVAKEVGSDISITRYVRFETGEGLAKKEEDFAAEVAKQIQ